MKKITFCLFVMTFVAWQMNAQFTESFESGIPASWTVINGGDAGTWAATAPLTGTGHTGTNVARLVYDSDTAHDDYLVTPQFTVVEGTADRITFWYRHISDSYPEIFDVLLSSGGNTAADFTVTLATNVTPNTVWQELSYDLAPYIGQTVYIAFHSTTLNEYELYLDDIVVDSQPTDVLDYFNLQYPATGSIGAGSEFNVYAQAYEAGLTDTTTGQAPGIESWIGYSTADTNPNGADWIWFPASFNTEAGNNDEYMLNLGVVVPPGTLYYASRWRLNGGIYTYGGIQADESYGGIWGEDNNISGVLTVSGPVNDECSGAIALTVNADLNCGIVTSGTTIGATASPQPDDAVGTPNNDVWFSFVATGTTHTIALLNVVNLGGGTSTSTDMAMSVFNDLAGCNMVAANEIGESDPDSFTLTGLTAGSSYFIRVYGYYTTIQNNSFNICVGTPPGPPANDECDNAISLTVNADYSCGVVTAGTNASATASPQADDVTGTPNNDVWYSFVATNVSHSVSLNNVVAVIGTSTDMGMGVYDGTSGCAALVFTADSDPNTLVLSGLTIGNLYYVRVYGWASGTGSAQTNFNICVGTPPPPPANDDCSGAIALTPGTVFGDNPVDGSVGGATLNGETNACGSNGPGVWYSVVVPDDGNILIEIGPDSATSNTDFDSVIEAFSGTCGDLTSINCDDDGAATNGFSLLNLTGQTAGSTIYIRVWEYGGNEFEPFAISAHSPTLSVGEFNNPNAFVYFPNPVKNELMLKAQSTIQSVTIYNMLGQEVLKTAPNSLESKVNMVELQTGAYFVKVSINDAVKTIRIIKQ